MTVDLGTTYLGLRLSSPLVPSGSPLTRDVGNLRHMEDAGAGAIALHSLFQEQIEGPRGEMSPLLAVSEGVHRPGAVTSRTPAPPAARAHFRLAEDGQASVDAYVAHLAAAKAALDIPVIASLNGVSAGEWLRAARAIEAAGADALELNLYYVAADPLLSGAEIEESHLQAVRELRALVTLPLAVKLSPYYTSVAHMARWLTAHGASGLVLFDRFYQPDIDPETLTVVDHPALSTLHSPEASRLPMRWIALLYGRVEADLAASGGIHVAEDVIKMLMAGATVTMLAAELMRGGIDRLRVIRNEVVYWMERHEHESLDAVRGRVSQVGVAHPAAFERAHYLRVASHPLRRPAHGDETSPPWSPWGPWTHWDPLLPPVGGTPAAPASYGIVPDDVSAKTARRPLNHGRDRGG